MIDDLVDLKQRFDKIQKMGWIETMREGTTGIGYTFETLIGKQEEDFPIPDFKSIEIKTRFKNAKEDMTLFNATPDGDFLYPMKRIYDDFGFYTKNNPNNKSFYAKINTNKKRINSKFRFQLYIDRDNKKIRLLAFDNQNRMIDPKISWSFDILEEKLYRKLKYLAFIKADCKYIYGKQHFHYYSIKFYMLKNFEKFLKLIEEGIVSTTFMIGTYKTGIKKGMMNSHGVGFDIAEENLERLFIKVCEF
mgnify:CR=1 FL=1